MVDSSGSPEAINVAQSPVVSQVQVALQRLIDVVAQLRSPIDGCPWDLAQTPQTLIPYVVEEAYEVVNAIRSGQPAAIAEELGDLLLQVVLQSQIASEQGDFDLAQVAEGIADKLIRRHPHVFAGVAVSGVSEVMQNWDQIKAAEKGEDPDLAQRLTYKLRRYALSLPPLMATMKISRKVAAAGFEWENVASVWDKFAEELQEFQAALQTDDRAHQQAELGDVLFTLVNLARWYDLDPDAALQEMNHRFIDRLVQVEAISDRPLESYSLKELEALWQQAKARLKAQQIQEA